MADANTNNNNLHRMVPLPPSVEQLLTKICTEQKQRPIETKTRQKLASLGEEEALNILRKISGAVIRKTLDAYILFLANRSNDSSGPSSPSPTKRLCLSPQSQQQKIVRFLTPTRLMMTPDQTHSTSTNSEAGGSGSSTIINPQSVALGELEFRKAFLILSYIGGRSGEKVVSADQIREFKNLPMPIFESEIWTACGHRCEYIKEQDRVKYLDWDSGKTHIYHCHVHPDGTYRFKGPYLTKMRNVLQRTLGDDNVLMVKFAEEVADERRSMRNYPYYHYEKYKKIIKEGILVGLRRYRFFVFKDGGKEEKKKDTNTSPVKCFFVRTDSNASIDDGDYLLTGKTVRQARSIFMHVDSLPSLANYMARFSLILLKTMNLEIDLSSVDIETIADEPCLDTDGNPVYDKNGKLRIHTDGTGFISRDLALKCLKNVSKGKDTNAENYEVPIELKEKYPESHLGEPPLLIQFHLLKEGRAVKGTFQVNKKLRHRTIQVRPSMVKVEADPKQSNNFTINSLEVVGTSNQPKKGYLSRILIALLNYGGVPEEFFIGILNNSLEDVGGVLSDRRAVLRVVCKHGDTDDNLLTKMISCGIPLEESYLQYRLSMIMIEETKSLKGGKIPVSESYYLMGTVDPTGLLMSGEVCIILDNGPVSGNVLVYGNPSRHFGDIHVLKATYVKELKDFVGNAKYGIFFPRKGPQSLASGDFDGDMYFVSQNPELLNKFSQSEPWLSSSPTYNAPNKTPSEFSDDELEDQLFKLYLETRFRPSYAVDVAADSWLSFMDRLLTLGVDCTDERACMKKNLCELIDIYYDALGAPNEGGRKIEVPEELKPELFPHYMEKREEISYKSTSILGLIYDKVKSYEEGNLLTKEIWKLPCFDVDASTFSVAKWEKLYNEYRPEMVAALRHDKETKNEAANEVIKKYKEILYEAAEFHESRRKKEDIFDEARAIYQITYKHAKNEGVIGNCSFAWRVAGSALIELYRSLKDPHDQGILFSPSTLKEIFG